MHSFDLHDQALPHLFDAVLDGGSTLDESIGHPGLREAAANGFIPKAKLGQGGTGEVWRGTDRNTDREISIKVPHLHDPAAIALLDQEARALAELQPPHVAALFRTGGEEETRFIVLEYIDGPGLLDYAQNHDHSLESLVQTMRTVCQTVAAVHQKSIVHGDIKPSNLLVRKDGSAVLIDFGLSTRIGQANTRMFGQNYRGGTDRFAAPETRGTPSVGNTIASEIYALGVTFQDLTNAAGLPANAALQAVIDRATDDDPGRRFASVDELSNALKTAIKPRQPKAGLGKRMTPYAAAAVVILSVTLLAPWLVGADP